MVETVTFNFYSFANDPIQALNNEYPIKLLEKPLKFIKYVASGILLEIAPLRVILKFYVFNSNETLHTSITLFSGSLT